MVNLEGLFTTNIEKNIEGNLLLSQHTMIGQ